MREEEKWNSASSLLGDFDSDLQEFYQWVITRELDLRLRENARLVRQALRDIVEAYKVEGGGTMSIRFSSPARRCAYVLKHSACFTSAVARHLLRVAACNGHVLDPCLRRGALHLCCLGGGPASDAVAVCGVLAALGGALQPPLTVRVTLVDINEDWEETARNVLDAVGRRKDLFGTVRKVELRFLRADLTQPFGAEVERVLAEADVVTMVYFLSAVNGGMYKDESLHMVQGIMERLKPGSLLFFLDSARKVNYHQMAEASLAVPNIEQLCRPRLEEFHTLSIASVRRFIAVHRQQLGRLLCMTNCFVSSSSWTRLGGWPRDIACRPPPLCLSGKCLGGSPGSPPDFERFCRATRKMLSFRARVQRILEAEFEQGREDDFVEEGPDPLDSAPYGTLYVPVCLFQTKSKRKRIFTG